MASGWNMSESYVVTIVDKWMCGSPAQNNLILWWTFRIKPKTELKKHRLSVNKKNA